MQTGEFDVALSFNRFNLLDWSAEEALLPQAATHNVGVTMGRRVLSGLPVASTGTGATTGGKRAYYGLGTGRRHGENPC